jgi:septum formation protein
MAVGQPKLVLASGSARRLALLQQVGVQPDVLRPINIDETPRHRELPRVLARRLAEEKAAAAAATLKGDDELKGAIVIAADTVVAAGRRIIGKPEMLEEAAAALRQLSGRAHRVYSAVCLIDGTGKRRERVVQARVRFKRLSRDEIESYLASGEWRGKAGGYAIQGLAGAFVANIIGSYTAVVGLPLHETVNMLMGAGYKVQFNWLAGGVEA